MPDERRSVLLRRRLGLELDSVLGGEVVERVGRPARLDQVRHEERVVDHVESERLGVVSNERGAAQPGRDVLAPLADDDLFLGEREPAALDGEAGLARHLWAALPRATGSSTPSSFIGAAGSASSITSTRCRRFRNSYCRNISLRRERSGGRGRARRDRSRAEGRAASSRAPSRRAPGLRARGAPGRAPGESSSTCSSTPSREPYWAMSCPAVLSPIPGRRGCCPRCPP